MDDDNNALDILHEALRNSIDQHLYGFRSSWMDRLEQRQTDLRETNEENSTLRNRVTDLLAENATLKSTVASLQPTKTDHRHVDQPTSTLISKPPRSARFEDRFVEYKDWSDLTEKYNTLAKSHKTLSLINQNHQDSRSKAKKVISGWQKWAEQKEATYEKREQSIAKREQELGIENTIQSDIKRPTPFSELFDDAGQTPLPSSASVASVSGDFLPLTPLSLAPIRPHRLLPTAVEAENRHQPTAKEMLPGIAVGKAYPEPTHLGSSQTTQDETDHVLPNATLPAKDVDSDVPEVVLERPVKRKRNSPKRSRKMEDESTEERRLRIKQEPLSSPPRTTEVRQLLNRTETLDLDEVDEEINTPRKRRRMHLLLQSQRQSFRAAQIRDLQSERSNSLPRDFVTESSNLKEEDVPNDPFQIHVDEDELNLEDRHCSEPRYVGAGRNRCPLDKKVDADLQTGALKEISSNAKLPTNKTAGQLTGQKRSTAKDRPGYHIHILSEDGEEPLRPDDHDITDSARKQKSPEEKLEAQRRLQALMEGGETPIKQNLSLTRTPITRPRPKPQGSTLYFSKQPTTKPETPSASHLPAHQLPTPTTTAPRTRIPIFPNPRPARAPLRSRPLSQLLTSDFKPNPKHNQGLSYAFSETVRDRASRRCLPGCTKPTCCGGAFRAMVEAGARPTLPKGLFEPTQDETEAAEEERLLRHYLGGAYKAGMEGAEREDVLLKARTELLANAYGKHRQAFERRSSPEGFWDTEMPSTQRIEEMREEGARRERVAVEERWREAMRGDGSWVFKDE